MTATRGDHAPELRRSGPVGARRRLAPLPRAALADSVTEFAQAYFGTSSATSGRCCGRCCSSAVLLVGLHAGLPLRPRRLRTIRSCCCSTSSSSVSSQESTPGAVHVSSNQEGIVRKTQFPRLVIPLAVVLTALFNLGLNLIVGLRLHRSPTGVEPTWSWLPDPDPRCCSSSSRRRSRCCSPSLYVRFRDVVIIWSVAVTALFYGTPLLYPLEIVAEPLCELPARQPADAALRADARVDGRPQRPRPRGRRRR